jgi:colicin import membrane protein
VFEAVLPGDDERERAFRRALYISVGAHLVLLGLAFVNPFQSRSYERPAGVMNVSLVAAVPGAQAAAARPAAKPPAKPKEPPKEAAKPVPPPEPQVRADKKLLPKEAVQAPKPAPPKPKPAVKPPEKELDYDDALSSLREELGEPEDAAEAPDPELLASVKRPAGGPAGMGGTGDPLDPLIAAWIKRVKIHVSRAWVLEPSLKRQIIEAEIVVSLDASGRVLGVEVQRRSGNPYYDESVVRALEKASPLPPPPEDGDWAFVFTPQDVF